MRSSKSRSRSKNNRNRPSGGNIINRVFDSSGPEGKVRGTPQQIIDKYNQLTRDAQLSGDRVAAENFAQHAEHYTRMLSEAQREIDQRREQHEQQQRDRNQNQQNQPDQQSDGQNQGHGGSQSRDDERRDAPAAVAEARPEAAERPVEENRAQDGPQPEPVQPEGRKRAPRKPRAAPVREDDVIETKSDDESGLVETPESRPKPRRTRKPKPKPESSTNADAETNGEGTTSDDSASGDGDGSSHAAE